VTLRGEKKKGKLTVTRLLRREKKSPTKKKKTTRTERNLCRKDRKKQGLGRGNVGSGFASRKWERARKKNHRDTSSGTVWKKISTECGRRKLA